jgi:hypothetical protein
MASRALRRRAAAMLRWRWARRMPMARLRRLAMARGALPVRTWEASSGEGGVADVVQRLDAPVPAYVVGEVGGAGLGGGEAGDRVDRHGPPPSVVQEPDPAGDADRLGGVGEVQASDGGDLEPAELDPAMAAVTGVVLGGDVAPGQDLELLVQRGLVVLHDQHVGGVLDADQPVGVFTLGVERVGSHHPAGEVQPVQQRPEPGDLVGLAVHPGLA